MCSFNEERVIAPEDLQRTLLLLNNIRVGTDCTPNSDDRAVCLSTSMVSTLIFESYSCLKDSMIGCIILQGPHHVAKKSTRVGFSPAIVFRKVSASIGSIIFLLFRGFYKKNVGDSSSLLLKQHVVRHLCS